MTTITERLEQDKVVLLDGGVTTEIQKRGVPLDPNVWSGLTTKTHPDDVLEVHEEYIRAGSEVITANTYSTARHVLESIMLGHEAKLLNFKSVQIAQQARDNAAQGEVWVAGSMSSMPPLTASHHVAMDEHARTSYMEQAEVLAQAGADLIIVEMMRDIENASIVIEAALSTGLPVWVGYSTMMDISGQDVRGLRWLNSDDSYEDPGFSSMVQTLAPLGGQAAGIMHTRIGDIDPALQVLSNLWDGPLLAYAETGKFVSPDWDFKEVCPPDDYADVIKTWIDNYGLKIIGGCCGTGPEHIRALRDLV